MIDLGHPGSHHMHGAQDNIASLLPRIETWKSLLDGVRFNAALIRKHISGAPLRCKSSDNLQCHSYSVAVLVAQKEMRADVPRATTVANVKGKEPPAMLVGIMGGVDES